MYTVISAFMDGFTGGSLLTRLRRPGAPSQVFADESSTQPQAELLASLLQRQSEQSTRPTEQTTISETVPTASPIHRHASVVARRVLNSLNERDRLVLKAVFLEQKDKDIVLQDFGLTPEYFRVLLHRARLSFRNTYWLREEKIAEEVLSSLKRDIHGISQ